MKRFIERVYKPLLARAIEYRWTTLSAFIAVALVIVGLIQGGFIRISYFPEFGGDFVMAQVEIQEGAPDALIVDIVDQMNATLREVDDDLKAAYGFEDDVVQNVFAYVQNGRSGRFQIELAKVETRTADFDMKEFETRWREKVGEIAGTTELQISTGNRMGGGPPVSFRLSGRSIENVENAAEDLVAHLKTYYGLYEVESSAGVGPEELRLEVRPRSRGHGRDAVRPGAPSPTGVLRCPGAAHPARRLRRPGDGPLSRERAEIHRQPGEHVDPPSDGRELPFHAVATYEMERGYNAHQPNRRSAHGHRRGQRRLERRRTQPGGGATWSPTSCGSAQPLLRGRRRHGHGPDGAGVLRLGDDLGGSRAPWWASTC